MTAINTSAVAMHPAHLITGWEYVGELCRGDGHTGSVWECPTLARIPQRPGTPASAAAAIDRALSPEAAAAAPPAPFTHALILCPNNAHHAPVYLVGSVSVALSVA
jgi:sucrose-6-phosphate hydrolase SacC (GH32 family)